MNGNIASLVDKLKSENFAIKQLLKMADESLLSKTSGPPPPPPPVKFVSLIDFDSPLDAPNEVSTTIDHQLNQLWLYYNRIASKCHASKALIEQQLKASPVRDWLADKLAHIEEQALAAGYHHQSEDCSKAVVALETSEANKTMATDDQRNTSPASGCRTDLSPTVRHESFFRPWIHHEAHGSDKKDGDGENSIADDDSPATKKMKTDVSEIITKKTDESGSSKESQELTPTNVRCLARGEPGHLAVQRPSGIRLPPPNRAQVQADLRAALDRLQPLASIKHFEQFQVLFRVACKVRTILLREKYRNDVALHQDMFQRLYHKLDNSIRRDFSEKHKGQNSSYRELVIFLGEQLLESGKKYNEAHSRKSGETARDRCRYCRCFGHHIDVCAELLSQLCLRCYQYGHHRKLCTNENMYGHLTLQDLE